MMPEQLIEQWREKGNKGRGQILPTNMAGDWERRRLDIYLRCADELSAALAQPQPTPDMSKNPEKSDMSAERVESLDISTQPAPYGETLYRQVVTHEPASVPGYTQTSVRFEPVTPQPAPDGLWEALEEVTATQEWRNAIEREAALLRSEHDALRKTGGYHDPQQRLLMEKIGEVVSSLEILLQAASGLELARERLGWSREVSAAMQRTQEARAALAQAEAQ